MFSTYTILFLICYLPLLSTTPIAIYQNARFDPFDNHSIIYNYSSIETRHVCICRCFMNSTCKTATYNGYYQYCVLYLAYLQEGQLESTTTDANSSVISLKNMTFPGSIISSVATAQETTTQVTSRVDTTAIETSSSHTLNTMPTTVTTAVATTAAATNAVATCTTLITFDDIPNQSPISGMIPNSYKNLNWTNAEYINVSTILTNSGYMRGVRSQPFVMDNPAGNNVTITTANGTRFSIDSFYITSAWRDNLSVTMNIIRAGTITSTEVFSVMTSFTTYMSCNFCTNIDTITLQAQGGNPHANFAQNGTEFIIDNLCISFGH